MVSGHLFQETVVTKTSKPDGQTGKFCILLFFNDFLKVRVVKRDCLSGHSFWVVTNH